MPKLFFADTIDPVTSEYRERWDHSTSKSGLKDHYGALRLPLGAAIEDCKNAFKRLSVEYHPDKHHHKGAAAVAEANKRFLEITEAKNVLIDKGLRRPYNYSLLNDETGDAAKMMSRNIIYNDTWAKPLRRRETKMKTTAAEPSSPTSVGTSASSGSHHRQREWVVGEGWDEQPLPTDVGEAVDRVAARGEEAAHKQWEWEVELSEFVGEAIDMVAANGVEAHRAWESPKKATGRKEWGLCGFTIPDPFSLCLSH
ncbi:unnamed protein product [Vitrella brassicaformis CCMP3155]|uniref:J domain-containing protein n=1 Tax=Vitrella brassicaformis (strain CCMP3155) TaxID=1169540 RepID=A0A0G4GE58_VITBC|nr:unnamed protein product [Vitrella brassicaformis CCMP3155]|eukprot:CEM27290.1 unnamed protein product [Vitrella brassicaformis CCMP3155]